jgi:hypothetical protein
LTIQAARTTGKAAESGSIAPAIAAKAANGVAHANAKLVSAQAAVSSKRQTNGAIRASTGVSKRGQDAGRGRLSDNMEAPFASGWFYAACDGKYFGFPPSDRAGVLLAVFSGIDAIVGREPGIEGWRRLSGHFDLAERDAQCRAAEPVVQRR